MQHRPFNGCVQFSMPFLLHETLPRPPRLSSSYYPPNQTFPHSPYQPVFSEWGDTMPNCQSVSMPQTLQLIPPIKLWTTLALPTRHTKPQWCLVGDGWNAVLLKNTLYSTLLQLSWILAHQSMRLRSRGRWCSVHGRLRHWWYLVCSSLNRVWIKQCVPPCPATALPSVKTKARLSVSA
jgi:hypothetical protein